MFSHIRIRLLGLTERYQKEVVALSAVVLTVFLVDKFLFLTTGSLVPFKLEFFGLWVFCLWLFRAKASASYLFGLLLFGLSLPLVFWDKKFVADQLCLFAFLLWWLGFCQDIFELVLQKRDRSV